LGVESLSLGLVSAEGCLISTIALRNSRPVKLFFSSRCVTLASDEPLPVSIAVVDGEDGIVFGLPIATFLSDIPLDLICVGLQLRTDVGGHLDRVQVHVKVAHSPLELVEGQRLLISRPQLLQGPALGCPLVDCVIKFEFLQLFRCLIHLFSYFCSLVILYIAIRMNMSISACGFWSEK